MKRNPEVRPWMWWALGGTVILWGIFASQSVVQMVKDQLSKSERIKQIQKLAAERGIPEAVALAIFTIESGGQAFGKDGRMIIRFEPHVFKCETDPRPPKQRKRPCQGQEIAVLRAGQAAEWDNFNRAAAIDPQAAMRSISMGAAQIMGFNHEMVGFPTVQAMFDAFSASEPAQIKGFFDFVKAAGLESAARTGNFLRFAQGYNGAGQQGYDTKMKKLYDQYVAQGFKGIEA